MHKTLSIVSLLISSIYLYSCKHLNQEDKTLSHDDKSKIKSEIQVELNEGIEATRTKNIDLYMSQIPNDFVIYDESGEVISREKQKEYALRDWSIIDTTLSISMTIDSIQYMKPDSVHVYTFQKWERMMYRRDGIAKDTVLTNQRHREIWKKTKSGWYGYEVKELGGKVYINGKEYNPK